MQVVIAPDSFGGTLTSPQAARAIADGWLRARPDDRVTLVPMADGGEGTLAVVAAADGGERREAEVAGPLGRPTSAAWLLRPDGTAVIESAAACGLAQVPQGERDPLRTTTYGVGQLLEGARRAGTRRVSVGLGGSASVDGGAGAALALGIRATRDDGGGLKIGGGELATVRAVERGWLDSSWDGLEVVLWADVTTRLADAASTFGPQKGATPEVVERLRDGLQRWADVVERDLGGAWRDLPGSGAAGGLGFGLAAVVGGRLVAGAAAVADLLGLPDVVAGADLVVTGEGRLDATSLQGKVVGHVVELAREAGVEVLAVVGALPEPVDAIADVESAPHGAGGDPAAEVAAAAERIARRRGRAA
ncbi:MAG TPA: glycerate kinase [Nitriliruptorales bacterium]|nr:glycerate kinase [Nitriliruptorales bacterium]